jgi:hypothetical protein
MLSGLIPTLWSCQAEQGTDSSTLGGDARGGIYL